MKRDIRYRHGSMGSAFLWILIVILVVLVGAAGGYYYFFWQNNRPAPVVSPQPVRAKVPPPPASSPPAASVSPTGSPQAGPADNMHAAEPPPSSAIAVEETRQQPGSEKQGAAVAADGIQATDLQSPAPMGRLPVPAEADRQTDSPESTDVGRLEKADEAQTAVNEKGPLTLADTVSGRSSKKDTATVTAQKQDLAKAQADMQAGPSEAGQNPVADEAPYQQHKPAPFAIQTGAFLTKAYAQEMTARLKKKGYDAYILETTDARNRKWYFVRCGRFESRKAAQRFLAQFKKKENIQAIVAVSK